MFKKSIRNILCGGLLTGFMVMSGNATAEGLEGYIGGGATYSNADCGGRNSATIDMLTLATSVDCDNEIGYQIHAGVDYKSDSGFLLGVEIGYLSQEFDPEFTNTTIDNGTGTPDTITISQPGDLGVDSFFYGIRLGGSFLDDRLDVYVRGGLHSYDADDVSFGATVNIDAAGNTALPRTVISTDDGTEFYYGIGTEYDVWEEDGHAFAVRLDYTRYDLDNFGDLDVISLTGQYQFDISGF